MSPEGDSAVARLALRSPSYTMRMVDVLIGRVGNYFANKIGKFTSLVFLFDSVAHPDSYREVEQLILNQRV